MGSIGDITTELSGQPDGMLQFPTATSEKIAGIRVHTEGGDTVRHE